MDSNSSSYAPIPDWMNNIAGSDTWKTAEPILKGWSADQKYRILTQDGRSLLLRLSEVSLAEAKRAEFERVRQASALGIPMSLPIDFGLCTGSGNLGGPDGKPFVYSLLSWIEGEDAQDILPSLAEDEAYRFGHKAGEWLHLMHTLPAPTGTPSPLHTVRAEIERKHQAYVECGYRLPFDRELFEQIEARLPLLNGVAPGFRQGDYHPGNMIIGPDHSLHIIDFNRSGTGDPYRDFNRLLTFTSRISLPFAQGQLDGYLSTAPHDPSFFGRLSLYCAMESLFAITWAVPFGEPEIGDTLKRSEQIWTDFNGFKQNVPIWYENKSCD